MAFAPTTGIKKSEYGGFAPDRGRVVAQNRPAGVSTVSDPSTGLKADAPAHEKFLHYLNPLSKGGFLENMGSTAGTLANPFMRASVGPMLESTGLAKPEQLQDVPYLGNIRAPQNMVEGLMTAADAALFIIPAGQLVKPLKFLGKGITGLPQKLYAGVFKENLKTARSAIKKGLYGVKAQIGKEAVAKAPKGLVASLKSETRQLAGDLMTKGVWGSDKKLLGISSYNMNVLEDSLQELLKGTKKNILKTDIAKSLEKFALGFEVKVGEKELYKNTFNRVMKDIPQQLSVSNANIMKRELYKIVKSTGFLVDAKLSAKREIQKNIAKAFKENIEKIAGTQIKEINHALSVFGKLENQMIEKLAAQQASKGVMGSAIKGAKAITTAGIGTMIGGAPMGVAALGAIKAGKSTLLKTGAATALNNVFKIFGKGTALGAKGLKKGISPLAKQAPGSEKLLELGNMIRLGLMSQIND